MPQPGSAAPYLRGLTKPPGFVVDGTQYITITGSISYGIATDDSDFDTVGSLHPVQGYSLPASVWQIQRFEVWEHLDADALGGRGRTYDFNVYSIVKFFQLAMDNNPNMLDALFHAARVRAARHQDSRRSGEHHIDPKSFDQMNAAMSIAPAVAGALMADAHVGYGLPIGGVLALDNAVCPYAVGVDIACRMKMSIFEIEPQVLESCKQIFVESLHRRTFFGVGVETPKGKPYDHPVLYHDAWAYIDVLQANMASGKAIKQLGTSGSGNHFVEFGLVAGQ